MPRDISNLPYVDNYPLLKNWLDKHHAICDWQLAQGREDAPLMYVEQWRIKNRCFVVLIYNNNRGWEICTPCGANSASTTFEDAEKRLGIGG